MQAHVLHVDRDCKSANPGKKADNATQHQPGRPVKLWKFYSVSFVCGSQEISVGVISTILRGF